MCQREKVRKGTTEKSGKKARLGRHLGKNEIPMTLATSGPLSFTFSFSSNIWARSFFMSHSSQMFKIH